ncbi:MAG: DUF45 domain-containing protein [Oscillospiraceae bacterium]|nr:DUF45 domain-containing protein [Oscillospiraceae bacterium]
MKTISLPDGRQLCYELTRKRVKNVNFRIKADGIIYVSASTRVSVKWIEQHLTEHADAFFAALSRAKKRERAPQADAGGVRFLGEDRPVVLIHSAREAAVYEDGAFRVFTAREDDGEHIRALLLRAVSASFARLCEELNTEVRAALTSRGLNPPPTVVTIKEMSSRWGSCSYTRGHISINLRLSAYPREAVLSVFWHEYAHYWHHDHSAAFYAFLDKHYPEYRRANALLKRED